MQNNLKLTCLFSHYNAHEGIADYVYTYLKSLERAGFGIVFISNSPVREADRQKLTTTVSGCKIFERENKGYDFGGWKWAVENQLVPPTADYILLANDSVFGPLWDLRDIITSMVGDKDTDFWGLTDSYQKQWHIQSYFLLLKREVFESDSFRKILHQPFDGLDKNAIIQLGEIKLAQVLVDAGFKAGVFFPYTAITNNLSFEQHNPTHAFWELLIREYRFPFIKRELVTVNPEDLVNVEHLFEIIETLSDYQSDQIIRYLIEYCSRPADRQKTKERLHVLCHLSYPPNVYYFLSRLAVLKKHNAGFIFNLSPLLAHNKTFLYILRRSFPEAVIISAPDKGSDTGGKFAALQVLLSRKTNSDYSLVIHDKISPATERGIQWRKKLLEIIEDGKIEEVLHVFKTKPKVGVIGVKELIEDEYDHSKGVFRCTSNDLIRAMLKRFHLRLNSYHYVAGAIFWIRTSILSDFFSENDLMNLRGELEHESALQFNRAAKIHAWERMFSFLAKAQGFKITGV